MAELGRVLVAFCLLSFLVLATAPRGEAANTFGIRLLHEGAETLHGSRVSIATPADGDFTLGGINTLATEADAAAGICGTCGNDVRQIQVGFTASNIVTDPCQSSPAGNLIYYVAILKNEVEICHPLNNANGGRTNRFSVQRGASGTTWKAYINGNLVGGSWNAVTFGESISIWAGGEINGVTGGTDVWGWFNDQAGNPCCNSPMAWQRQRTDGTWFTIQSSQTQIDSGWTVGILPSWIASH